MTTLNKISGVGAKGQVQDAIIPEDDLEEVEVEEEEESGAESGEEEDVEESDADAEVEADDSEVEVDEDESEADEEEADPEESEGEEGGEEGETITAPKGKKINAKKGSKRTTAVDLKDLKTKAAKSVIPYDIDNDEDEDEEDENYLQKFDSSLRDNFILNHHPEANTHNYEEVKALSRVTRDGRGIIVDPLHKTVPILTKYEMTRVIGQRAKQLDAGAKAFVKVPLNVIDGYHIAVLELEQKKLPFIIKRPFPNGGVEYWCVSDLEVL